MESARQSLIEGNRSVEALQVFDIFDMPDGDIQAATLEAMKRMDTTAENDMAIMYFWSVEKLTLLSDSGVLAGKDPTPLSCSQVEVVIEAIMDHDNYKPTQQVLYASNDGYAVSGRAGKIRTAEVQT